MSRHQSLLAHAALLLGVIAFAFSLARPTSAQQNGQVVPANVATVGRYQTLVASQGNIAYAIVTDTATGRTWAHAVSSGGWSDFGTPGARQ